MSSPSFPVEKRQLHTPALSDVAHGKFNLHKGQTHIVVFYLATLQNHTILSFN